MKNFLAKIWVPSLLVILAAVQSLGIDAGRAIGFRRAADSLALLARTDSLTIPDSVVPVDSLAVPDSLMISDSLMTSDSLMVPDSLMSAD